MARLTFDISRLRILLIEDDEFSREQEKTALEHLGVKYIILAGDGAEAIAELEKGTHVDVIVSDWAMPNMDGLELLSQVRKRWPTIPFLMVTGNETEEQVQQATDAGVDGYLTKPFSLDTLREVFQETLVARLTDTGELDPEIARISQTIRDLINSTSDTGSSVSEEAITLSRNLAEQLALFANSEKPTASHSEVVRLHAECINALLSGDERLVEHEHQNLIVDGLALARSLT